MERKDADRLLRWYPEAWKIRYGDELLAMVEDTIGDRRPGPGLRWSLAASGMRERARRSWLVGRDAGAEQRTRGGATLVLWGWALLLPAGFSFAKLAEHWQVALTPADRTVPAVAMASAAVLAFVGGAAVLAATAVAMPALVRGLRHGAWKRLRAASLMVAVISAAWLGLSIAGVIWAHQLTETQRNGGNHSYGAMAYAWGSLTVLTVAAWTALAVRAERQLEVNRTILRAEALGSMLVTVAIAVVTVATVAWWVSMAMNAPSFLQGFVVPPGQAPGGLVDRSSPVNLRLVATALAMVAAVILSGAGTLRIARSQRHAGC